MMRRRRRLRIALLGTFGVLSVPLAASAAVVYVDDGDPTYSESGSFAGPDTPANGRNAINDDFRVGITPGSSVATYSPDLPAGTYYVQAHWTVNSGHTPDATYSVNGTPVLVNQQQTAAQGAIPNAFPPNNIVPSDGSGWYTLGQFVLGPGSTVVLSHGSAVSIADGIRFGTDFVEDERRAALNDVNVWTSATMLAGSGDPESTQYLYSGSPTATATYRPGVSGLFGVDASWAVDPGHTTAARYVVDLDGNSATTGDQTTADFNQQVGTPGGTWSGYNPLGTFLLTADSTITLSNAGGGNLTADGLRLSPVPEPSSVVAFGAGAAGLLLARRRRRTT